MKKLGVLAVCGMVLAVSACGHNAGERALTGGTAGALAAGPVGAVAGATLGATGAVQVK
ncbi:MAG: hypothetical protein Q4G24_09525 [Paracoccus sp. (in: a-proteobacteria)]|uniref:hypothetical protein n=1 Tax=Paracoccus sp. TaxID=267 RepID=UPI0026DFB0B7|nr:hypothetical protein [Paracoccus sp. (in: a-proteobacteria)]MDO5621696.1 hypothetical protein [Paracoccus sp. (in: a-proteobacteria)]